MIKDKKLEINTLTISIFRSHHKALYVSAFVLVNLLIINSTQAIDRDNFRKLNRQEILYKLADDDEDGEYKEGAYYVYNIAKGHSDILSKSILMSYTEAWITINNQYVILEQSSIRVLNSNRMLIAEKQFTDQELAIGGQYSRKYNKVFFLLRVGNSVTYTIDLYQFDLANRRIEKVAEDLRLGYEGIEEPFKEMFFVTDDKLVIRDYNYQFLEIDLASKVTKELIIDDSESGRLVEISQNKNGLVYLKYSGYDKLGMHYKLMQYDFRKPLKSELVKDIANIEWERKSEKLFSDSEGSSFCVQIGSKAYLYNHGALQELPIKFNDILAYHKDVILYQTPSLKVRAYFLNKNILD